MADPGVQAAREKKRKEKVAVAATASQATREQQAQDALSGNTSSILSGTEAEQQGQLAGLNVGTIGYGQGLSQTGSDIQRVKDLQRQRTEQSGADPVSAAIMNQKATALANAQRGMAASGVSGGAAAGALSGIERAANADIAASLYGQQAKSIADERSLASNMLAGTTGLMYGEKAANVKQPSAPDQSGMSVICTELHRQGIMPTELYLIDTQKGVALSLVNPDLMVGYHWFGIPLAEKMKTSPLLTKILTVPAMAWANQIAGRKNILGAIIFKIGVPVCTLLGKLKQSSLLGAKYV